MGNLALKQLPLEQGIWTSPEEATDGNHTRYTLNSGLAFAEAPASFTIDLKQDCRITQIRILLYDGLSEGRAYDGRYKFSVSSSLHGESFDFVYSNEEGGNGWFIIDFERPIPTRFIRFHGTSNTADKIIRLVQLEVYETPPKLLPQNKNIKRVRGQLNIVAKKSELSDFGEVFEAVRFKLHEADHPLTRHYWYEPNFRAKYGQVSFFPEGTKTEHFDRVHYELLYYEKHEVWLVELHIEGGTKFKRLVERILDKLEVKPPFEFYDWPHGTEDLDKYVGQFRKIGFLQKWWISANNQPETIVNAVVDQLKKLYERFSEELSEKILLLDLENIDQDHFYTSTPKEEKGGNNYKRIGTQFHILKVQTPGSVPLQRYYSKDYKDHFYCIYPEKENIGMMKRESDLGFVFPDMINARVDPMLTPLHRYHSADFHDHLYTIEKDQKYFKKWGYEYEGIECYVLKEPTAFSIPVELWVLGVSLLPIRQGNIEESGVNRGIGAPRENPPDKGGRDDDNGGKDKIKDKIPFHLDKVVSEDKLGREPIAKVFVDLIKKDIFTDKLQHSFLVHLQGSWGSGKSSFMNFIKTHLNKGNEKWIVIEYNAWQNQHISPPWWTLIDQIYRQSLKQLGPFDRCCLWFCEKWRRIIWYTGWQKAISLLLTVGLSILLILNGSAILEFVAESSISSTHTDNKENGITLAVFAKLLITFGAAVGVIYSFSKFISTPFFLNSSQEAVSFVSRATDPMTQIKEHFNGLVDNINSNGKEKRQLTVFIDDIDRCNREFIVQLLEGIQTLFKEKRVLYIVAGEKQWITTSFANKYKEFAHEDQGHRELGELFLEKAFQLSFRMPTVSPTARKKYWNHIIGVEEQEEATKKTESELNDSERQQIRQAMTESTVDIGSTEFIDRLEEKFGVSPDVASNLVLDEKNKDKEEIRHLLVGFHDVINQNPRSIIRLANAYTIMRSTIIVERKDISGSKIFRWLIVDDLLPNIKMAVSSFHSDGDVANYVGKNAKDEKIRKDCLELLFDEKGAYDGALTLEDIKSIVEA